ncbi:hypothetical protein N7G274_010369 [Stereocaulon virgatum]|uniref:RNA polymerase I associated factor, A49-like protein n=1 Tax=Stereocaulon virgatum TaxID=373712 RepID=A0ABR3ZTU3_9LECA
MSDKKRKRSGVASNDRPHKKIALQSPAQTVKVSVIEDGDDWTPVLASTPGITLPSSLSLKLYTKARPNASRSALPGPELLLHSADHPRLDYTAQEENSNGSDGYLKHYIGVYDPQIGKLELAQARKLVVRSTLRLAGVPTTDSKADSDAKEAPKNLSARSTLGLAFGTKKSQKAIRALTANAIQASPSKSKSGTQSSSTLDPLASAVVSSMAASTSSMPTKEEMQAEIDEAKPLPKPNMQAETPAEVYPVEDLVGGIAVLKAIGVKEWIDKVNAGKDIQTKSLFVARRLRATVQSGDVKKVKILKYLLLLIEWFRSLKPGKKTGHRAPKPEDLPDLLANWGSDIVNGVNRRFAEGGGALNKWHLDNLITHILALTLTLDNYATDTHDILKDLKLEIKALSKYYLELGCGVALPTETERTALGIAKAEAASHRIARLRLPLVFPKMRIPAAGKKKR